MPTTHKLQHTRTRARRMLAAHWKLHMWRLTNYEHPMFHKVGARMTTVHGIVQASIERLEGMYLDELRERRFYEGQVNRLLDRLTDNGIVCEDEAPNDNHEIMERELIGV